MKLAMGFVSCCLYSYSFFTDVHKKKICYCQIAKINGAFFVVFSIDFQKKHLDIYIFLKNFFIFLKNRPCYEIIIHTTFCSVLFMVRMV